MTGYICGPRIYEFEGVTFETSSYSGPWPLRKDGEPKARAGRVFWELYNRFDALPDAEKEKFRVGGGCIAIT